jgi:hypothetical protein
VRIALSNEDARIVLSNEVALRMRWREAPQMMRPSEGMWPGRSGRRAGTRRRRMDIKSDVARAESTIRWPRARYAVCWLGCGRTIITEADTRGRRGVRDPRERKLRRPYNPRSSPARAVPPRIPGATSICRRVTPIGSKDGCLCVRFVPRTRQRGFGHCVSREGHGRGCAESRIRGVARSITSSHNH